MQPQQPRQRPPAPETEKSPPRIRFGTRTDVQICAGAVALETFAVLMRFVGRFGTPALLLLHLIVVGGLAAVLMLRLLRGADTRCLALNLIATAVAGPIGALAALLMGLFLKIEPQPSKLLEAWYQRISGHAEPDRLAELYERIKSGRARDTKIETARQFGALLANGSLADKQRLLGVIAQKYHPDFASLLQQAMNSPDAPIRVQAAAVAAKLRTTYKERLVKLLGTAQQPVRDAGDAIAMARALIDTASAKILEEADVAAAQDAAKALCATALQHDPDHVDALVLSAEIFAAVGDDAAAAEILKPLAELGRPEALAPYRACLLRLGRYSDFAGTTPKTAAA